MRQYLVFVAAMFSLGLQLLGLQVLKAHAQSNQNELMAPAGDSASRIVRSVESPPADEPGAECRPLLSSAGKSTPLSAGSEVSESHCEEGQAILFHAFLIRKLQAPRFQAPFGNCCPLPPGALLPDHVFATERCPENRVVTGGRISPEFQKSKGEQSAAPTYELRCTLINSERWKLKNDAETVQLDFTFDRSQIAKSFDGVSKRIVGRRQLPARYRFAFGQLSSTSWAREGCLGFPWGAPMTAMGNRGCEGFSFASLESLTTRPDAPVP